MENSDEEVRVEGIGTMAGSRRSPYLTEASKAKTDYELA
jgi:hypothetical protein